MSLTKDKILSSLDQIGSAGLLQINADNTRGILPALKIYARRNKRRLFSCIYGGGISDLIPLTAEEGAIIIMDERLCRELTEQDRYNLLKRMIEEKGCLIVSVSVASESAELGISTYMSSDDLAKKSVVGNYRYLK